MKFGKLFAFLLTAAFLVSMTGAEGFAEQTDGFDAVINDSGSTYYNDGETVFNNYGTVYNNGGIVYNNGGIVYNNGGTVYNNGGTVYNNSGTCYNNGGEVTGTGAVIDNTAPTDKPDDADESAEAAVGVEDNAEDIGEIEAEEPEDGRYKISLATDYSLFAYIEGPDKSGLDYFMDEDDEIRITAKPGFTLLNSSADTGRCTMQEDGSVIFADAERDGTLTLTFKVDAPVIMPEFGTYGEAQSVKIIVADGVTVYYSLDGSTDLEENGKVYDGNLEITFSTTLRVMAAAEGAESSRVVSGHYLIPIIKAPVFAEEKQGYASIEPQAITVENTGIDKLKIQSVKLTGNDADCFILSTEKGGSVAAGQHDKSTWKVAPVDNLKSGEYKAAAEFTFSNGSAATVDLSFTVK